MIKKDGTGSGGNKGEDLFREERIDYIEERNHLLRDTPYETVRRAWFTMSHLLLDAGSKILDMGCGEGHLTYAMAALNPHLKFTGIDKSKRCINVARQQYKLHNLEFKVGDASSDLFKPGTVDCIINSFLLHRIFSDARYNEQIISDTLRKQFTMLKTGGTMFIRDYAKPPRGEYVLMEMHDEESQGDDLSGLSEADLLVWYSEHARPKQDPGCGGFFLEELSPRFPKTRLFRLPFKWAYEFIMRKDRRDKWESDLPFEYTFYTVDEFRHELHSSGARVEYSAPHWDEDFIRKNFTGHFRLLQDNGETLGDPPTSFIAVAKKMPERTSLNILERRITEKSGTLSIKALRDEKTGKLIDIVTRNQEFAEILPYRTAEDGRLHIFLHDGIARGLVNAVPRSGSNIDGREWSGHMIESVAMDYSHIKDIDIENTKASARFVVDFLGMKAERDACIESGSPYYPDPNYIDERVHTYYVNVTQTKTPLPLKSKILQSHKFQSKGSIREFVAQHVLDAIAVGLIPNGRLELQILALMQHLNVKAENWISKDIAITKGEVTQSFEIREFLRQVSHSDTRFKEVKGSAGQLRTVNSIFVEEGHSQGGRIGLSSEHVDFVLSDERTINTAVILPITTSMKGDIHAGFLIKHLPVPQRYEGNGMTVSAPQLDIPKEIKNYRMLKQFIAEKFGVTPEMVIKLGESYFSHVGITPQRIHPFAIAAPPNAFKDPKTRFMPMYQYMLLWRSISKEPHFMTTLARAYRYLPEHMKMQAKREVKLVLEERFRSAQPDWSVPSAIFGTDKEALQLNKKNKGDDKKDNKAEPPSPFRQVRRLSDYNKKVTQEKKQSLKRQRLGFESRKADHEENLENITSGDAEALEKENKEKNKPSIDLNLVEEFESEIQAIRDAIDLETPDDKPKPDKW